MPQIPVEVSRSLALALPRARLVMLEGEQPVLFMEDPDGVVSMLADFVASGVEPPGVASGPEAAATASGRADATAYAIRNALA